MTSDAEYFGWVRLHCLATAANAEASASLVSEVARRSINGIDATAGELGECTQRLLDGLRVPKFASEHVEAVLRELRSLRAERATATAPDHSEEYYDAPRCRLCGGDGLVAVPVARCVWQGRLVDFPGMRSVLTGAALCDERSCAKGREVRDKEARRDRPRATYTAYCRRFGGVDLAALLAEYERGLATAARKLPVFTGGWVGDVVEQAKSRAGLLSEGAA